MGLDDWFEGAGKFAADVLGLGPNSYPRGLSVAATQLAETLDRTISNTYVESGWVDVQKTQPNIRNVITQTPELIVVIKKRMFSSLRDNFTINNMDDTEKAFIVAAKKLFENKCKEISAYEKLTKVEKIVKKDGALSGSLITTIIDSIDQAQDVLSWSGVLTESPQMSDFKKVASKIRDVLLLNNYSTTTNWTQNTRFPSYYTGAGTGVIELTMVTRFDSTTSIRFGQGQASFSIIDPYRLLAVTEQDVERAIFETSDYKFNLINGLADTLQQQYDETVQRLNDTRNNRGASPVTITTNPYSRVYNRIMITLERYGIELTSPDGDGLRRDLFGISREEAIANFEGLINVVTPPSGTKTIPINPSAQSLAQIEIFTPSEESLLQDVFDKATLISIYRQKDFADFIDYGQRTNYIRRAMRQNFLGKQIIQPMDIVTAFITSQTIDDNAALAGVKGMFNVTDAAITGTLDIVGGFGAATTAIGGLLDSDWLTAAGTDIVDAVNSNDQWVRDQANKARSYLMQQRIDATNLSRGNGGGNIVASLNKNIGDLKELWGSVFGTDRPNYAIEAEKNILAGPDFPMYLYLQLRSYFGATDFGPCVFNGVVTDVSESSQPGNSTISVSCKDNCYYFEQGLYQDKPGVDQFNGHLYNPLTPFDVEFDEATGQTNLESNFKLLDENLELIQSGILRYKFGRFVNQTVTDKNIHQTSLEEVSNELDASRTLANYNLLNIADKNSVVQDIARKVFYNPDGFVYRWKKGIGTAWISSNSRNLLGGVLAEDRQDNQVANIIRQDPFSGQDLVNIISLLVTGEPYNLSTFINASIESGILRVTPGQTINDYVSSLTRQIRRQNQVWGDFIPFKRFSVNPSFFNQLFTAQLTLKSQSKKIEQLQIKKSDLMQKLMQLDSTYQDTANLNNLQGFNFKESASTSRTITVRNAGAISLVQQIINLDNEIKSSQAKITNSLVGIDDISNSPIRIFADDVYSSYDGDMEALSKESRSAYKEAFNRLKTKQNYISQRRLWQVKANCDTNLFIVCDEYDHDVDIQATVQSLGSLELINSKSFPTVASKISAVSKVIGMEIFANSQGHIELRIPQYNKIPSSLFFEMAEKKRKFGIQYYPTFLEKTFQNRLENVYNEIEELEDWIRIYSTVLGYDSDEKRALFLAGSNITIAQNQFVFITDETLGTLSSLRAATSQIANDFTEDYEMTKSISITAQSLGDFFERNLNDTDFVTSRYNYFSKDLTSRGVNNSNVIAAALQPETVTNQVQKLQTAVSNTTNNFDVVKQIENLTSIFANNITTAQLDEYATNNILINLLNRQSRRTGTALDATTFIKNVFTNSKKYISPSDVFAIEQIISKNVSQRYKAILTATSIIRNLDQSARANGTDNSILAEILLPNLVKGGDVPDFMAHMIEDETEDDYGPGAGKRYVISPEHILSSTYKEQAPEFTTIKVQGAESGGLVSGAGFDVGSGMEIKSVWAADYDLWRMYGFKDGSERYLPFLNNVETQLAPYAIFLLNQQKAALLHASVTRVGNEFIQPGEVYYLKDRDLLFYCEQVTQSFAYGTPGSFTTTMTLTYGHSLGEYIPTPLDVIGKSMYKGHYTNVGNYTLSNPTGALVSPGVEIPLGAVVFTTSSSQLSPYTPEKAGEILLEDSEFGAQNKNTLTDIQYKIKNIMTSNISNISTNMYASVALRIYHQSNSYNPDLEQVALYISGFLQNSGAADDQEPILQLSADRIIGGNTDDENVAGVHRLVDLKVYANQITSPSFPAVRTPSAKAIELAKQASKSQRGFFSDLLSGLSTDTDSQTSVSAKKLKQALTNNIIDIWIEFINPATTQLQFGAPFTTSNINQSTTSTTKNEINPTAVDDFYNNIKSTDGTYQSETGASIKIDFQASSDETIVTTTTSGE